MKGFAIMAAVFCIAVMAYAEDPPKWTPPSYEQTPPDAVIHDPLNGDIPVKWDPDAGVWVDKDTGEPIEYGEDEAYNTALEALVEAGKNYQLIAQLQTDVEAMGKELNQLNIEKAKIYNRLSALENGGGEDDPGGGMDGYITVGKSLEIRGDILSLKRDAYQFDHGRWVFPLEEGGTVSVRLPVPDVDDITNRLNGVEAVVGKKELGEDEGSHETRITHLEESVISGMLVDDQTITTNSSGYATILNWEDGEDTAQINTVLLADEGTSDDQTYSVVARDEEGNLVYLGISGGFLSRDVIESHGGATFISEGGEGAGSAQFDVTGNSDGTSGNANFGIPQNWFDYCDANIERDSHDVIIWNGMSGVDSNQFAQLESDPKWNEAKGNYYTKGETDSEIDSRINERLMDYVPYENAGQIVNLGEQSIMANLGSFDSVSANSLMVPGWDNIYCAGIGLDSIVADEIAGEIESATNGIFEATADMLESATNSLAGAFADMIQAATNGFRSCECDMEAATIKWVNGGLSVFTNGVKAGTLQFTPGH